MKLTSYVKPQVSNTKIDKAAETLLASLPSSAEYRESLALINQWRSSHLWPLDKVRITLGKRSRRVDLGSIVVQRLKRLSSIESKMARLEGTRLTGMQDIGGCRSILKNVDCVDRLVGLYEEARDSKRTDRSALVNVRDYINSPRPTGYRGVHLIVRYQSNGLETSAWNGRKIEVQVRTRLQHYWATALESMSSFLKQPLKADAGDPEWLRFFALTSGLIADWEKSPGIPGVPEQDGLYKEALSLWKKLRAGQMLHGCSVLGEFTEEFTDASLFVLKLDSESKKTTVHSFGEEENQEAVEKYIDLELEFARNSEVNVVLVRADDLSELKIAYPNYWADTSEFSQFLKLRLENHYSIEL